MIIEEYKGSLLVFISIYAQIISRKIKMVIFANQSFLVGRIEKLFYYRNSKLIRSIIITYSDKRKLVHRTVKLIDCIPFVKGYELGTVSDTELVDMIY